MKRFLIFLLVLALLPSCNDNDSSNDDDKGKKKNVNSERDVDHDLDSTLIKSETDDLDSQSLSAAEIANCFTNKNILGQHLRNCLEQCVSAEDSSACISETIRGLNAKMNSTYLLILEGEEVIGYEEHLTATDEVQKSQNVWLKFKEQELYVICDLFGNYESLKLDTVYPRNVNTFDWCDDQSNMGMRECATKSIEYYNEQIETRIEQILQRLDQKGKQGFKRTQLAWMKYKKSQERIHHKIVSSFSGSMYPTSALIDAERVVRQRAKELEAYLSVLNRD